MQRTKRTNAQDVKGGVVLQMENRCSIGIAMRNEEVKERREKPKKRRENTGRVRVDEGEEA